MDDLDENPERPVTLEMGEHLRTWRLFVSLLKWNMAALGLLLLGLLLFRT
ncbi:MAG: hypothetical protein P4L57_06670 [Rhizomicrobium sp.]|nr:hypothetical protein [Rhizomicrobium sp.]